MTEIRDKYIRTKNGRLHEFVCHFSEKQCSCVFQKGLARYYFVRYSDIVDTNDSIGKLVDCYVKVTNGEMPRVLDWEGFDWYKGIKDGVPTNIAPFKLYGAIWRKNGLIYVAEYQEHALTKKGHKGLRGGWVLL